MASRDLEDLLYPVRVRAERFLLAAREHGLDILIYCTYRSPEEQDELYSRGRTKPGRIVTNARGGDSFHNHRCAFDFVPLVAGKPQWDDKALYLKAGSLAESVGLEWSGRWQGKLRETAHCQYTGGLSLSAIKKGQEVR
jgi:peptidoglycan L-alanyl-D-glutamate endopeptidase CwlK